MNKKILIIVALVATCVATNAQSYYGQSWLMGAGGIYAKFTGTTYQIDTTINLVLNSGKFFSFNKSNLCDSNGNIHLVTDGYNIMTKDGFYIEGGDTLCDEYHYLFEGGYSHFAQTGLFLPMQNGKCYFVNNFASQYMIDSIWSGSYFNINYPYPLDEMNYSTIDLYANNGDGKVTKRLQPLLTNALLSRSQMMACRHGDGKDWWLFKMAVDSNNIHSFLVTQDSIYNKGIQRMPFARTPWSRDGFDYLGQMTFNSDGTKMATTKLDYTDNVYIADFDRCYGNFSNYKKITAPHMYTQAYNYIDSATTGLCFSPNGQFLYVAKENFVLQYDLTDQTWFTICANDTDATNFMRYAILNLAPDGKIYIGNWLGNGKQMSVINNPNGKGANCNFCRKCFRVNSYFSLLTTPPCMPNYGLDAMPNCWPLSSEQLAISSEQLEVYPNPSSTIFEVRGSKKGSKKELYNSIGQLIISTKENEIDVHNLSKGMYYLKVGNQTKKVVVE